MIFTPYDLTFYGHDILFLDDLLYVAVRSTLLTIEVLRLVREVLSLIRWFISATKRWWNFRDYIAPRCYGLPVLHQPRLFWHCLRFSFPLSTPAPAARLVSSTIWHALSPPSGPHESSGLPCDRFATGPRSLTTPNPHSTVPGLIRHPAQNPNTLVRAPFRLDSPRAELSLWTLLLVCVPLCLKAPYSLSNLVSDLFSLHLLVSLSDCVCGWHTYHYGCRACVSF